MEKQMSDLNSTANQIEEIPSSSIAARDRDPEPCHACGSHASHRSTERYGWRDWRGLGEKDWCSACGADHEHWSPTGTLNKPLSEWEPGLLLLTAHDVQLAYEDASREMTREQVEMNRDYFKRLIAGLDPVIRHGFEHRAELITADQRWETLRDEASELMEKVHGMGRIFYKNESGRYSESELADLIKNLKSDLVTPATS
jgi:hypothetical protein